MFPCLSWWLRTLEPMVEMRAVTGWGWGVLLRAGQLKDGVWVLVPPTVGLPGVLRI